MLFNLENRDENVRISIIFEFVFKLCYFQREQEITREICGDNHHNIAFIEVISFS